MKIRNLIATAILAPLATGLYASAIPAHGDTATPYGGCKEARLYSKTSGADLCRARGWVVKPRLLVSPRGVLRESVLPSCTVEDASSGPVPCSWNFPTHTDGNGVGASFYVTPDGEFHYVWVMSPVYKDSGFEWIKQPLADALSESGLLNADTRNWRQCAIAYGETTWIVCPDGYTTGS